MSRHRSVGSYGHRISKLMHDVYQISWVVDRYYKDSRLRHPTGCCRTTDRAGALRFAKRWGVQMPEDRNG